MLVLQPESTGIQDVKKGLEEINSYMDKLERVLYSFSFILISSPSCFSLPPSALPSLPLYLLPSLCLFISKVGGMAALLKCGRLCGMCLVAPASVKGRLRLLVCLLFCFFFPLFYLFFSLFILLFFPPYIRLMCTT